MRPVRDVDELVGLRGLRAVGSEHGARVGHHDVHAAVLLLQFGGQPGHGVGVGDVEHPALHPAPGAGGLGDVGGGVRDPPGMASSEQNQIVRTHPGGQPLHERAAEALVGTGDESDACNCHALHARSGPAMRPTKVTHLWYA